MDNRTAWKLLIASSIIGAVVMLGFAFGTDAVREARAWLKANVLFLLPNS